VDVLDLVAEGISFEKITEDYYPDLEIEDISACVESSNFLVS
jgi:uncharacterized protein (DUF433 family)